MIVLVLSYRHMNCANPTRSCCKFALIKTIMRGDAIKHPRDILSNPRDKPKLLAHAIILLSNHNYQAYNHTTIIRFCTPRMPRQGASSVLHPRSASIGSGADGRGQMTASVAR